MTTSILSKVLGNNAFYTDTYIRDTATFIKSIIVKNNEEAKLFNTLLTLTYPTHVIDRDPTQWRYYKHLQGLPYILDALITLTSIDSGETITLSRQALLIHRKTRQELLKFGLLYDTLVKQYPQQQLFIKAVMLAPVYINEHQIVALADYTIIAYDKSFIEDNEHDIIPELQQRVINYKPIWLIPYYANIDNLFLASQYAIFYQFLFTSMLSIRLANAKTVRAHSFHIRLFLASHYRLDEQMLFLSRRQQLYLYRNLLYLSNHSGKNHVFRTLINELFNEHNVSVINYVQNQNNTLDESSYVNYSYKQKLLNSKELVYTNIGYDLQHLRAKEKPLAPGNAQEYDYNYKAIDRKNKRSLVSTLLTKDLETILIDETDTVRYKIMETVADYWAYLVKHNHISFLTEIIDPVTNVSSRLNPRDLFKLYSIVLFASQGVQITSFPVYQIKRVFKSNMPSVAELLTLFYDKRNQYAGYLQDVIEAIPAYATLRTNFEFGEFVGNAYKLDVGLWHLLSNYSDANTQGQMEKAINALTTSGQFDYSDETVAEFIARIGIRDPRSYEQGILVDYSFSLIDEFFNKKLSYIRRLRSLQQALAKVFFNFNSYTVQLINNYYNDSPILAGIKDRRYTSSRRVKINIGGGGGGINPNDPNNPYDPNDPKLGFLSGSQNSLMSGDILNVTPVSRHKTKYTVPVIVCAEHISKITSLVNIHALVELDVQPYILTTLDVQMPKTSVFETEQQVVQRSINDVYFNNDITHICTKLRGYADVAFNVNVSCKVRYLVPAREVIELAIDVEANTFTTGQFSEDSTLLFLTLNPSPDFKG